MRVLVTGGSSFLGSHLLLQCAELDFRVTGTYHAHAPGSAITEWRRLDIADAEQVDVLAADVRPDAVVHLAAMTVVAGCEKNPRSAERVNVLGTRNLAKACSRLGARMIHISTDMVFDGTQGTPYAETDEPAPVTVYGATKLQGEQEALTLCPRAVVLRPALMYGKPGGNTLGFLPWMRKEAEERKAVPLFADQYRTPVFVRDICSIIWQLVRSTHTGIFHAGGPDRLTRVEMGKSFLPLVGIPRKTICPVRLKDVKTSYAIQPDLSLDSLKIRQALGFSFTPFAEGIRQSVW